MYSTGTPALLLVPRIALLTAAGLVTPGALFNQGIIPEGVTEAACGDRPAHRADTNGFKRDQSRPISSTEKLSLTAGASAIGYEVAPTTSLLNAVSGRVFPTMQNLWRMIPDRC